MEWWSIGFGVLLTLGTAIFVATEFALVTLDPGTVPKEPKDRRGKSVTHALTHLSTELSSSQVGITVTTILLGYTAQPAVAKLTAQAISPRWLAEGTGAAVSVVVALVLINMFSMLVGELIPKNFALSAPLPVARIAVPLQRIFTVVFGPLIAVLNGSANSILRRFGVEPREELSGARSATELAFLVRRSAQFGTLDSGTARLLTNSIELDELTAVDVMTDRTRLSVLRENQCAADVIELARKTGHSRFPIIGESRDDIIGLVHVRRAVAVPRDRRHLVPVTGFMAEAPRVPETVGMRPLMIELRGLGLQMAVVVDEYGGTAGVVTLEDVVEELVGEVADEHDRRRIGALQASDGSWLVPGELRPDELRETTGLQVPEDHAYETLAGLVMARLGRIAVIGDAVVVPGSQSAPEASSNSGVECRVTLRVAAINGRRIERLRIIADYSSGEVEPQVEESSGPGVGQKNDGTTDGGAA